MARQHYDDLITGVREVGLLDGTASILSWDQETMMPRGGIAYRAKQLAQLAGLAHHKRTDPRLGELLAACEADPELSGDPASEEACNLRELRRDYERATKLPDALVTELAETTSLAQHEWAQARAASDFARFLPWLEKLLELSRRKAECLGWPEGGEAWDALADGFEPDARAAELQPLFAALRQPLTELVGTLVESGKTPPQRFRELALPIEDQERFVRFVVEQLGFDFGRGRLDRSTHPFSTGSHCDDVRITTRFSPTDVLDALGSTMHEAGHGMYEQGLPRQHTGTPLGEAVSLGIHESQSRLWENQVGRGEPFWRWCQPQLERFFGADVAGFDAGEIYRSANTVRPDFIRVEADEATYNLHVMVRFELELALLRGDLAVADVPATWNRLYRDYLGLEVPDDARGCLQDVHWSCGMFGYFPTYTLGNLYAAQLFARARRELGDLDDRLAAGDFTPLRRWLNEHVHAHGRRYPAAELCRVVTGAPLSPEPLLGYLGDKLRAVYGL